MFVCVDSIQKGDQVAIEILEMNRWKDVWGPDADQFRCVSSCTLQFILLRSYPHTIR